MRAAVPLPTVGKAVAGTNTAAGLMHIGGIYPHQRKDGECVAGMGMGVYSTVSVLTTVLKFTTILFLMQF